MGLQCGLDKVWSGTRLAVSGTGRDSVDRIDMKPTQSAVRILQLNARDGLF